MLVIARSSTSFGVEVLVVVVFTGAISTCAARQTTIKTEIDDVLIILIIMFVIVIDQSPSTIRFK